MIRSANQTLPPCALLNSLNELNGTTQRCSRPSHRFQCLLLGVADVGDAAIGLHPQQLLEIDALALGFEFAAALLRRLELHVLRRRHAPARHRESRGFLRALRTTGAR